MAMKGNKYGTHRVIEPKGVLTQAAWKVDNDMTKLYSNEIICNVTSLNVDSASFTQIVIEGPLVANGEVYETGTVAIRPPGMPHGPFSAPNGALTFEVHYYSK